MGITKGAESYEGYLEAKTRRDSRLKYEQERKEARRQFFKKLIRPLTLLSEAWELRHFNMERAETDIVYSILHFININKYMFIDPRRGHYIVDKLFYFEHCPHPEQEQEPGRKIPDVDYLFSLRGFVGDMKLTHYDPKRREVVDMPQKYKKALDSAIELRNVMDTLNDRVMRRLVAVPDVHHCIVQGHTASRSGLVKYILFYTDRAIPYLEPLKLKKEPLQEDKLYELLN